MLEHPNLGIVTRSVGELVILTFGQRRDDIAWRVNWLDGDRSNNKLPNLEWVPK